ncbi:GDP-D-glucose phosphorylase 1 [Anopheles darlingi]|uniref:GDP-D-glucose phosphorylase 1 n=1 Tax=Anopheles darlingi TaxID=43151 RepID=UPI0021003529|nr:GDP-D-glucose phosphorylase 1 [Anopheles darlingi]XP_049542670.1 GDP-D-glucose phosphorylase 1 [Anopheles darlingi]XP_049542677.1 GDP-D-glucose phosphorylase 1 [Anopheles darlingi]
MNQPIMSSMGDCCYQLQDAVLMPEPELQQRLESAWTERHAAGIGFRYRLNIEKQRIVPGHFQFLLQLNRDRLTQRRQPQQISLDAPFDESIFNFTKVHNDEVLLELQPASEDIGHCELLRRVPVTLLINNSPLSIYHSLVVPERHKCCPQRLTPGAIRMALELLYRLPDRRYRLSYNSPGALASVNHQHLHLVRVDHELYVQRAPLIPVGNDDRLTRLTDDSPVQGYCYELYNAQRDLEPVCRGLHELVNLLARRQMPYNLFFTWTEPTKPAAGTVRVLVYPRLTPCVNKSACSFNAAALEMSGYVSVGDAADYEQLDEGKIRVALQEAQGDVYGALQPEFASNSEFTIAKSLSA